MASALGEIEPKVLRRNRSPAIIRNRHPERLGASVASIRIPEGHRDTLVELASMTEGQIRGLRERLDSSGIHRDDLIASLNGAVSKPKDLVESLMALTAVRFLHGTTVDELAIEIFEALNQSDANADIRPVLSSPRIAESVRVYESAGAWERGLSEARIVTDARSIFNEDSSLQGMLISQKLVLSYYDSGRTKDLLIEVDRNDLRRLSEQALQALAAYDALDEALGDKGIPVFSLEPRGNQNV